MISQTSYQKRIQDLEATIERRSLDPAWKIQNAAAGHDQMSLLDPFAIVQVAFGDIRNLKLWNTAFAAQPPLDTIFASAFASIQLRASDIFCRFDGGDQLALVITSGDVQPLAERINTELESAEIPHNVQKRYLALAYRKHYGLRAWVAPWLWPISPTPHIDWVFLPPCAAAGLVTRIKDMNGALFTLKS